MRKVIKKIWNRLSSLWLKPIRIFVFHHVSDVMDPLICAESDWTRKEQFKQNILNLQKCCRFISMQEAIDHLKKDKFRLKHYAVLTADDGLRSTYELLPWLIEHKIPITLFICPKYLDGYSYIPIDEQRVHSEYPDVDMHDVASRMFITHEQLSSITSPYVTIASHGNAHLDATTISRDEFVEDVTEAQRVIENHPLYKPFFAYPWGHHTEQTDLCLKQKGIIPVLCDGKINLKYNGTIHRECIDSKSEIIKRI